MGEGEGADIGTNFRNWEEGGGGGGQVQGRYMNVITVFTSQERLGIRLQQFALWLPYFSAYKTDLDFWDCFGRAN